MSATRKTKQLAPAASKWPDLRHKYRRLAIPAVVAAVMAGKTKPRDQSADPERKERERE
jgi:hypothetical protein